VQYQYRSIEIDLWEGEASHPDQAHHQRWVTKVELFDSLTGEGVVTEHLPAGMTSRDLARALLLERLNALGEQGWRVLYYNVRVVGGEIVEWPLGIHFLVREIPA
jgi:hypothetical protein